MTILNQQIDCTANIFYTLQKHRLLWLLFCLTAMLDYVTTYQFMINDGIASEGNLIVRFLAFEIGIFTGVFIGKCLQIGAALVFCSLSRLTSKWVLIGLATANSIALYLNT